MGLPGRGGTHRTQDRKQETAVNSIGGSGSLENCKLITTFYGFCEDIFDLVDCGQREILDRCTLDC